MKNTILTFIKINIFLVIMLYFSMVGSAQVVPQKKSEFWKHVQFGGGIGLSIGSGYTDITLAPIGVYNFNKYVSAGIGLQGSYVSSRNFYKAALYGGNVIGLFNPIEQVQLSVELEQVRVNRTIEENERPNIKDDFWNTGLFLGAGFRTGNVIVGARYNVLYTKNDYVYSGAFMPFVRVYF